MSYTTTQLADAVLRELGVVAASETPSTTDRTYVTDLWAAKWEELASHGHELVYFSPSEIPAPMFLVIRDLMMLEVQTAFGEPITPGEKEMQEQIILKRFRRHMQKQTSQTPVMADYS